MPAHGSSLWKKGLVAAAAALVALASAELVLRVTGLHEWAVDRVVLSVEEGAILTEEDLAHRPVALHPHPDIPYAYRQHPDWGLHNINSLSMRDYDRYTPRPSPRDYRILLIGDSVANGSGTALDWGNGALLELALNRPEAFASLTEVDLSRWAEPTGFLSPLDTVLLEATGRPELMERLFEGLPRRIEVLKGGIDGHSFRDTVAWLEHVGMSYGPHLVLYVFSLNNLAHAAPVEALEQRRDAQGRTLLEHYDRVYPYVSDFGLPALNRTLLAHSALYRVTQRVSAELARRAGHLELYHQDVSALLTEEELFPHLARVCAGGGSKLLLALVPMFEWTDTGAYAYRDEHRWIQAACARAGIPFVDLLPLMEDRDSSSLHTHHPDGSADTLHPNEAGNLLIASLLAQRLRPSLPPPPHQ